MSTLKPKSEERKMAKSRFIFSLLMVLPFAFLASPLVSKDDYQTRYVAQFSWGDFSFDKVMEYDMVSLEQGDWLDDLGKPMLPAKEVRIALPSGMKVTGVYVTNAESEQISGEYNILPAQPPVEIGLSDGDFVEPDKETYASTQPYPSKLVEFVHQGDLAGQAVATFQLHPSNGFLLKEDSCCTHLLP